MLQIRAFLSLLLVLVLPWVTLKAQIPFELPEDSVSFGIFVSDYLSGGFENGTVLNFPTCPQSDSMVIPWNVEMVPPVDFGQNLFTYACSGDTIWSSTSVWMGTGQILYPQYFLPADSFGYDTLNAREPQSLEYWWEGGPLPDIPSAAAMILEADSTWELLRKHHQVHAFAQRPYRVILFRWAPQHGVTNDSTAKWITFLYRNPTLPAPQGAQLWLSFPALEGDFPVVLDTLRREYLLASQALGWDGLDVPATWIFKVKSWPDSGQIFDFGDLNYNSLPFLNWSDTANYNIRLLDPSDVVFQTWMYPDFLGPPHFADINSGIASGMVIEFSHDLTPQMSADTLSFELAGDDPLNGVAFYPLAMGHKWKWHSTEQFIDSVRTDEVIQMQDLDDFTQFDIERRRHDYDWNGGSMSMDTVSLYIHENELDAIYASNLVDDPSIFLGREDPILGMPRFRYTLRDSEPILLLEYGNGTMRLSYAFSIGPWERDIYSDAHSNLVGYSIFGETWGDLTVIPVNVQEFSVSPEQYQLAAYPNPFNSQVTFSFAIPKESTVTLGVIDLRGRLVWQRNYGSLPAGYYEDTWSGITTNGCEAASGLYFLGLTVGQSFRAIHKIVLAR